MRLIEPNPRTAAIVARAASRVLMCPPTHFEVRYAINPWMDGHVACVDVARARRQWASLERAIERRVPVELMAPAPGWPDLPFTANAGVLHDDVFVPSRFRHAERRGEEPLYAAWFRAQGYVVRTMPDDLSFEGAGDVLAQPGAEWSWMGCGPRTDRAAAEALRRLVDLDVVELPLVDPRFYHLDTCFCPLPGGYAMYYRAALADEAIAAIEARIPRARRIEIDEADACRFACNAVVLGRELIVNDASDALEARLAQEGFSLERVRLDEFVRAGGAARCLTFGLPPDA